MQRVLDALRRNPDAAALAVLCLLLGVGRQAVTAHPLSTFDDTALRIHWTCAKPASDILDNVRSRLLSLVDGASEALSAPALRR
jgi:hypothetical protein